VNSTAATGPLEANQSATAPMLNNTGTAAVSAQARADYWSLGASASGLATGGTSSATHGQAEGFASFADALTISNPGIATGTAGIVNFTFLIEGAMQSLSHAPSTQQADAGLGIRVDGRGISQTFLATVVNQQLPFVRGNSDVGPRSFALGAGMLSGSALVTSAGNFAFRWGVPFTVEVGLWAKVTPCCFGASQNVDFLNTAVLRGLAASRSGGAAVTDFTVSSASGAVLGVNGLAPVPEIGTGAAMLLGLAGVVALRRQRTLNAEETHLANRRHRRPCASP